MTLYTESGVDQTDHFADAHVCIAYGYDVVTRFESVLLRPFCLEKSRVRKWIFMF